MPDAIVSRILRLPGYGVYTWKAEDSANCLRLWIRPTGRAPHVCGQCGRFVRAVHSWTERQVRDLPWATWTGWLVVEVHHVRCRRCGVRTERLPFLLRDMSKRGNSDRLPTQRSAGGRGAFRLASATRRR